MGEWGMMVNGLFFIICYGMLWILYLIPPLHTRHQQEYEQLLLLNPQCPASHGTARLWGRVSSCRNCKSTLAFLYECRDHPWREQFIVSTVACNWLYNIILYIYYGTTDGRFWYLVGYISAIPKARTLPFDPGWSVGTRHALALVLLLTLRVGVFGPGETPVAMSWEGRIYQA